MGRGVKLQVCIHTLGTYTCNYELTSSPGGPIVPLMPSLPSLPSIPGIP